MECDIHQLSIDDYDEVTGFWKSQHGVGLNESDTRPRLESYLGRNAGMSLIAREEGQIVGAVLCGHDGRRGYLHHLAVAESHRGRGLGRMLVERCLARLREEGIDKCNIFLFAENEEGRKFWQAIGWKARQDLVMMQRVV